MDNILMLILLDDLLSEVNITEENLIINSYNLMGD